MLRKFLFLGAAAVSWDDAALSLNNNMGGLIAQGDSWMTYKDPSGAPTWSTAITAYKQAGQEGATTVGPTIDNAGRPAATQPLTQKAWTLNGALQLVNGSDAATEADADLAQEYAKQMYGLYQQAIAQGKGGVPTAAETWSTGIKLGLVGAAGFFIYEMIRENSRR